MILGRIDHRDIKAWPPAQEAGCRGEAGCPAAHTSATVRASFVIDPQGAIRAITWYPMNVGRSVEELLRLVAALQTSDTRDVFTPEGWQPGDRALVPPALLIAGRTAPLNPHQSDWYYCLEAENANG